MLPCFHEPGFCITQSVFKVFCKSQFPHTFVNSFFMLVIVKDKLTNLCGNWLLQNDFVNTLGWRAPHLLLRGQKSATRKPFEVGVKTSPDPTFELRKFFPEVCLKCWVRAWVHSKFDGSVSRTQIGSLRIVVSGFEAILDRVVDEHRACFPDVCLTQMYY